MAFIEREYKYSATTPANGGQQQYKQDQHTTAIRSLKKLVKPLLRLLKKKQTLRKTLAEIQQQNANNASLEDMRTNAAAMHAHDDNLANEALEERLLSEIRQCPNNAAVIVQHGSEHCVVPVSSEQKFIPVHFARTSSGTFFWTSMNAAMARVHEMQLRQKLDRWGQA